MRIFEAFRGLSVLIVFGATSSALAFDAGTLAQESPAGAFKLGLDAYQQGDTASAIQALEVAADGGHPIAQWKLGQMYAEGDGIAENDLEAFHLFSTITAEHADENPLAPSALFVANAFVAVGNYYRQGIPNTDIQQNLPRARQMFAYAATYFGDSGAQLALAQMYYQGEGVRRDPRQAARWAKLAADKGNPGAQALLGHLLFEGDGIERQPVLGLMYLTVARFQADPADEWVRLMQEQAFSIATETERRTALALAESLTGSDLGSAAPAGPTAAVPTVAAAAPIMIEPVAPAAAAEAVATAP
ncbi:MAG: tetratricopeptide repeat protein [Alphaproteobacteria bacterium]